MERFCEPFLPKGRVRRAFISKLMPDNIVAELNDMGVITYKLGKSANLSGETAYHPDMLVNNYRYGQWICEYNAQYLPKEFPYRSIFIESEKELGDLYPDNCIFNNFRLNGTLFCGMYADRQIKSYSMYDGLQMKFCSQAYVKCSCVIVAQRAAITSDKQIGKYMRMFGIDVLMLPDEDDIGLSNLSHGLLGGCTGLLSKDLLAFTGNLATYKYGNDVVDFCKDHGVDAYSLTRDYMYDYGGILPITELVPFEEQDNAQIGFDTLIAQNPEHLFNN